MENKKGFFVVCEGLDSSGKTTTIKEAMKTLNSEQFIYCKGLKSNASSLIGKIEDRFPSTFIFLAELLFSTIFQIRPNLRKGKIVLQDRYYPSVYSFVPNVKNPINRMLLRLFSPFFAKPDCFVYFTVSKQKRIERLKRTIDNKYHQFLVRNPEIIETRDSALSEIYEKFKENKMIIDTSNISAEESGKKLILNISDALGGYANNNNGK